MPKFFLIEDISLVTEASIASQLSVQPYFIYLDSNDPDSQWSEFSYIGIQPWRVLEVHNGQLTTRNRLDNNQYSEHTKPLNDRNPFDIINFNIQRYQSNKKLSFTPFWGGAMGYVGYDASQYLTASAAPPRLEDETLLPDIVLGFYDRVIMIHKKEQKKWYIASTSEGQKDDKPSFSSLMKQDKNISVKEEKINLGEPKSNMTKEKFMDKVTSAKKYIKEGDIYQVNLSHRFEMESQNHNPMSLYQQFKNHSPAPYSGFFNMSKGIIYSASPEQFIKVEGDYIQTRPIKGTIARGETVEDDLIQKQKLNQSQKDQAELLMIVDLERNDLGKVCEYGSVKVNSIHELETYKHVYHLVSDIEGRLTPGVSPFQAFRECFPGGSITGAPKKRSMEIIQELESVPRQIYTGSLGYIGFNGNLHMNIAIRTMYQVGDKLYYHVGAGIVADSEPEKEWEETLVKAQGLWDLLRA